MNGIKLHIHGTERTVTSFYSTVVPPVDSQIYIEGYYYTVKSVEYYIAPSREYNNVLEATLTLQLT